MLVVLDGDAQGRRRVYRRPSAIISATAADEVPGALRAIDEALASGQHVAGWFGYELGYALEPKLTRLMPEQRLGPLLEFGLFDAAEEAPALPSGRAYAGPLVPEWHELQYETRFAEVKRYIAAGDIYQANLSFRCHFRFAGDPLALYEGLRAQSGARYCAYIDDGARQLLSLSPELFFALSTDAIATARPMKGTAPRDGDDVGERARLGASAKDRAENLMIVDLIRNDLGRIAEIGSVLVKNLFEVETYPTLHTMVSTVEARKRAGVTAGDIVTALFPCGSVTGAPKIRAMEILRELEASPRGAYCGAIGYFAPDGSAGFNVAIRTLAIQGGRGELGVGGGVVQDSENHSEYAECLLKARFFEASRRKLSLIETLRFENGFVRLDNHLARMKTSASSFGLAFDDAQARRALYESVLRKTGAHRIRLSLDENGIYNVTTAPLAPNPAHWTYRLSAECVSSGDFLLRHKTDWRDVHDREAACSDTDEVVFLNERGEVTEGARSNIFVKRGDVLLTPRQDAGILPGILRAELIGQGCARETVLLPSDLAGEVFFGNSLRGLIPARRV